MSAPTETLPWNESVREAGSSYRTEFVEAHVDLVKYVAMRISSRLPQTVEMDDLIHDGILGLLDAADRYDPARQVRFRTYAETRIRGAILDGLRQKDWRPRSVRQLKRNLENVLGELSSRHQRAATEEEIAKTLGLEVEDYRARLVDLNSGAQISLDDLPPAGLERAVSDDTQMPHLPLERQELIEALAEEIAVLPERERRVLELYYFSALNMKEVGAVLGVTESRVCQLHSQAAGRLRAALRRRMHVCVET